MSYGLQKTSLLQQISTLPTTQLDDTHLITAGTCFVVEYCWPLLWSSRNNHSSRLHRLRYVLFFLSCLLPCNCHVVGSNSTASSWSERGHITCGTLRNSNFILFCPHSQGARRSWLPRNSSRLISPNLTIWVIARTKESLSPANPRQRDCEDSEWGRDDVVGLGDWEAKEEKVVGVAGRPRRWGEGDDWVGEKGKGGSSVGNSRGGPTEIVG